VREVESFPARISSSIASSRAVESAPPDAAKITEPPAVGKRRVFHAGNSRRAKLLSRGEWIAETFFVGDTFNLI
jgi:hypothetical protein